MPRRLTKTQKAELVETHNMALSIDRLCKFYGDLRWRRALVHAMGMAGVHSEFIRKVREALDLP